MNPSPKSSLTRKVVLSAEKPRTDYRSDLEDLVCLEFLLGGGCRKTRNVALFCENVDQTML